MDNIMTIIRYIIGMLSPISIFICASYINGYSDNYEYYSLVCMILIISLLGLISTWICIFDIINYFWKKYE
jgi:hypothetical protein